MGTFKRNLHRPHGIVAGNGTEDRTYEQNQEGAVSKSFHMLRTYGNPAAPIQRRKNTGRLLFQNGPELLKIFLAETLEQCPKRIASVVGVCPGQSIELSVGVHQRHFRIHAV